MTVVTQLLSAIPTIAATIAATIVGATFGAIVSYYPSKWLLKAGVLSKDRQDWVNSLRDDLAEFQAILHDTFAYADSGGRTADAREQAAAFKRAMEYF